MSITSNSEDEFGSADNTIGERLNNSQEFVEGETPGENEVTIANNLLAQATARMVNYDSATGEDDNGALQKAVTHLQNFEFLDNNLNFYFNQIELKMQTCGVKKNYTKMQVLTSILPFRIQEEVMPILSMQETEFGDEMPYKKLKDEILKIFKPSQDQDFERFMGRVLSGRPSQLCRALINDICTHRLRNCCCHRFIGGQWKRQLPSNVVQAVAHLPFNADNLDTILQLADSVFSSTRSQAIPSVAAVTYNQPSGAFSLPAPPVLDTAFHQDFQAETSSPQVAALSSRGRSNWGRGRGQSRGGAQRQRGRGGRGGGQSQGQGGQEHPRHKGPRHPDAPPVQSCRRHWLFGKGAHFCEEPGSCPWKNFYVPKPNQ